MYALEPLKTVDDVLVDEYVARFTPGTRQWAFEAFDEWSTSTLHEHRVYALVAGAGVGKTGIMSKLARDRSDVVVAYHFCRHDDPRRSNPVHMLCSLAYQLAVVFPTYRQALEALQLTRASLAEYTVTSLFNALFVGPLNALEQQDRKVMLIDALDECDHGGKNDILTCIRTHFDQLPQWLGVYVTTRPENPITSQLKKFNPIELSPEKDTWEHNLKDIRTYFTVLLKDIVGDTGLGLAENADAMHQGIEALVQKSNGLFIYASMAGKKLRATFADSGGLTLQQLNDFPAGLDEFYETQMLRICTGGESGALDVNGWAWRTVELATGAREPLHYKTIQLLLGCTTLDIKRVVALLSRFFPIRDHRLHVYHKSVKDWLTKPSRELDDMFVDAKKVNGIFATRCWDTLEAHRRRQEEGGEVDENSWRYILTHGVAHLMGAGMKKEARTLVLDVGWLMARASEGLRVIEDCRLFKGDRVVDLIGSCVGLALADLRKDPRRLAGQLVGRLRGVVEGAAREREKKEKEEGGVGGTAGHLVPRSIGENN